MFIFDEPTTGLHTYDVDKLMKMIEKIVDIGGRVDKFNKRFNLDQNK